MVGCLSKNKSKFDYSIYKAPSIYSITDSTWVKGFTWDSTYLSIKNLKTLKDTIDTNYQFSIYPVTIDTTNGIGLYRFMKQYRNNWISHNMYYFFLKSKDTISVAIRDSNKTITIQKFHNQHKQLFDTTQLNRIKDSYYSAKYFSGGL